MISLVDANNDYPYSPHIEEEMSVMKSCQEKHHPKAVKESSVCGKLKYALNNITVEPIVLFFMIATFIVAIANQNLALEKTCRVNLRFNESICDAITERNKSGYSISQEAEVQTVVQKWEAYKSILSGSVPVVLVLVLGTWSDRHMRRKPVILLPLFGGIVSNALLLICSIYFMELKMQFSWLADVIPVTFTGGFLILILGVYSYVGSLGDEESRTMRIGMLSMTQTIAMSIGTFLSGIILHYVGFLGVYIIVTSIFTGSFLYGMFVLKEQEIEAAEEITDKTFALRHIKDTFKTCFKDAGGNRRSKMIIIMILSVVTVGPLLGEFPIIYLSVRLRFGWNEVDYSFYNSCHFVIQIIGNTFALAVLSKYLKVRDVTLGIIAMCSKIIGSLIYAFAPTGFFFYVGAAADFFHGANGIALRAMMSKIVPPHELGQSNSVFGICEGLTPLAFGPLYSMLYIKTMLVFPGAFFLVSGSFYASGICLYIWLYKETINEVKIRLEDQEKTEVVKELLVIDKLNETKKSVETMNV